MYGLNRICLRELSTVFDECLWTNCPVIPDKLSGHTGQIVRYYQTICPVGTGQIVLLTPHPHNHNNFRRISLYLSPYFSRRLRHSTFFIGRIEAINFPSAGPEIMPPTPQPRPGYWTFNVC